MYDPQAKLFWLAKMKAHEIVEEETIWYAPGGIEHYRPARKRVSKKYRDLVLEGPFSLESLRVAFGTARRFRLSPIAGQRALLPILCR